MRFITMRQRLESGKISDRRARSLQLRIFSFQYALVTNTCFSYTFATFRFVINTDTASTSVKEFLQQYYSKVWVEYVVKNPLWNGTPVTSDLFKQKSDEFIKQSVMFT